MSSAYNIRSQGSVPEINVIGEQIPPPQDPFADLDPIEPAELVAGEDDMGDRSDPLSQQQVDSMEQQQYDRPEHKIFADLVRKEAARRPRPVPAAAASQTAFDSRPFPSLARRASAHPLKRPFHPPVVASAPAVPLGAAMTTASFPSSETNAPRPSPLAQGQTPQLIADAPPMSALQLRRFRGSSSAGQGYKTFRKSQILIHEYVGPSIS